MLAEVNIPVSGTGFAPKEFKLLLGEDYALWDASHFPLFFTQFFFSFMLEISSITQGTSPNISIDPIRITKNT